MIDTIVLTLSKDMFHISDPDKFIPSARWALAEHTSSHTWITSKQNPTTKELRQGIYKPHLTLARRMNMHGRPEIMLKIELSLPKLMFGNNFNELQYKDFANVCTKLVAVLQTMGVTTTPNHLTYAPVAAIHYSKNILLTDGSTPYHYINKIKEANVKLSLDVNQTDYRNEGHSYKWHANSYEVVFYDKIRDLEKAQQSAKRAIEKDSILQVHLFDTFKKRRNKFEVLRMEVRLNKRQKMKQLFSKLDISSELTFKKLFKPAISKRVLLHYLDEVTSKRSALIDHKALNGKALLTALIFNNPELNPRQLLQVYGFKKIIDEVPLRELRNMFAHSDQSGFYRLMSDIKKVRLPTNRNVFEPIYEQISIFKAVRILAKV